jgi:hypothetical protein
LRVEQACDACARPLLISAQAYPVSKVEKFDESEYGNDAGKPSQKRGRTPPNRSNDDWN